MKPAQCFFQHGEAWAKESSMCKLYKISSGGPSKGSVGMMMGLGADVEFPKL